MEHIKKSWFLILFVPKSSFVEKLVGEQPPVELYGQVSILTYELFMRRSVHGIFSRLLSVWDNFKVRVG